jgi:hypothetical protein
LHQILGLESRPASSLLLTFLQPKNARKCRFDCSQKKKKLRIRHYWRSSRQLWTEREKGKLYEVETVSSKKLKIKNRFWTLFQILMTGTSLSCFCDYLYFLLFFSITIVTFAFYFYAFLMEPIIRTLWRVTKESRIGCTIAGVIIWGSAHSNR